MTEIYTKEGKQLDKNTLKEMLAQMEIEDEKKDIQTSHIPIIEQLNPALAEDEIKKKEVKLVKLNLACGQQKQDGFIGVDKIKTLAVDIVHDLETFPWSFALDNSVDEVICSHYVEHTKDFIKFMDELYRIMKKPYTNEKGEEIKSKATIVAPYYSSIRCWQDPTHVRAISEFSFLYFNKVWREQNKLDHYGIKSDWDFTYGYQMSPEWVSRSEEARVFAMKYYINVISDIHVVLTKR